MLSPPAMQGGRFVARAILAAARGESVKRLRPFHYVDKGAMATIGRNAAVGETGSLRLSGFIGWLTWLIVHIYYLIGFRNRLAVLASWAWNYIRKDRSIRIIARSEGDPLTEEMETGRERRPVDDRGKQLNPKIVILPRMSPTAIIAASRKTTRTSFEERLMIKVGIVGMGGRVKSASVSSSLLRVLGAATMGPPAATYTARRSKNRGEAVVFSVGQNGSEPEPTSQRRPLTQIGIFKGVPAAGCRSPKPHPTRSSVLETVHRSEPLNLVGGRRSSDRHSPRLPCPVRQNHDRGG